MRSSIPEWYKKTQRFIGEKLSTKNHGVKLCSPFFDSLVSGYMIPLQMDIIVERDITGTKITWKDGEQNPPVSTRNPEAISPMPLPSGYSINNFSWFIQSSIQLPKGYSALVTHPLNRFDIPFITTSGIMDCDEPMFGGNAPFFLDENFEGIIPQGTPIAQIIPFKRESWKIEESIGLLDKANSNKIRAKSKISGWYKNNVWTKKEYN